MQSRENRPVPIPRRLIELQAEICYKRRSESNRM